MAFIGAVQTVLEKYATFIGRASRSELWWWWLFVLLLSLGTQLIDGLFIAPLLGFEVLEENTGQPLTLIALLALLLPNIAVSVRRLHDIDRSGWWVLIGLVPFVGVLVLLYWWVQSGTNGPNTYGNDPLSKA